MLVAALLLAGVPAVATGSPVVAPPGSIATVAGTIGEGPGVGVAQRPRALAAYGSRVYVGSESLAVIRELDTATGRQRVVAGNGVALSHDPAAAGDGGPARAASLGHIAALATDGDGNLYAADSATFSVRRIAADGTIGRVAGTGTEGFSGDGGPARQASFGQIRGLATDGVGNLYVADSTNHRVRRVDASGLVTTVAGNGTIDTSAGLGDGGPATGAPMTPVSVAVDGMGRLHIGDALGGGRVRVVDDDGTITTVAGGGAAHPTPTGIPAASARIHPLHLAFGPDGALHVADVYFVSRLDPATGTVRRVAGTGAPAFTDFDTGGRVVDGLMAVETAMNAPQTIAVTADGRLYIGDAFENRVWRVDGSGRLATVAGTGYYQLAGDGGPALAAMFHQPTDVVADPTGGVLVADQYNQRIRRIDPSGRVSTVAGSGSTFGGFSGDGGPAVAAQLSYPSGIALDGSGNLFVADWGNHRIRRVDRDGTISTLAEIPPGGHSILAGIAVDGAGNVYLSQARPGRVLKFTAGGAAGTLIGSDDPEAPATSLWRPEGLQRAPTGCSTWPTPSARCSGSTPPRAPRPPWRQGPGRPPPT